MAFDRVPQQKCLGDNFLWASAELEQNKMAFVRVPQWKYIGDNFQWAFVKTSRSDPTQKYMVQLLNNNIDAKSFEMNSRCVSEYQSEWKTIHLPREIKFTINKQQHKIRFDCANDRFDDKMGTYALNYNGCLFDDKPIKFVVLLQTNKFNGGTIKIPCVEIDPITYEFIAIHNMSESSTKEINALVSEYNSVMFNVSKAENISFLDALNDPRKAMSSHEKPFSFLHFLLTKMLSDTARIKIILSIVTGRSIRPKP